MDKKGKPAKKLIKKGGLSAQDLGAIQEIAFVSGADLYSSGLPEWAKEMDTYKLPYNAVAIIQHPSPYQLDERGHYIGDEESDPYHLKASNELLEKKGTSYTKIVQGNISKAIEQISRFLAFKSAIEDFYDLVRLKAPWNMEACYESIIYEIRAVNQAIKSLTPFPFRGLGIEKPPEMPVPVIDTSKLEGIDITKLKPEAEPLSFLRKRIASGGIGKDWWRKRGRRAEPEEEGPEVGEEASLDA